MVFFLIFVVFTFLSFPKIRKKLNKKNLSILLLIFGFVVSLVIIYPNISEVDRNFFFENNIQNILIQFGIIFLIPISLIIISRYFVKKADVFEDPMPRIYVVIAFFVSFSILAQYIVAYRITDFTGLYLMPAYPLFFISLPLGIIGFKKFLDLYFHSKNNKSFRLIPYFILAIIILPGSYIVLQSYFSFFDGFVASWAETDDTRPLHEWIRNEVDSDAILMYEHPGVLFLRTGNPTIPIPNEFYDKPFELPEYVEHFGADYLVIFNTTARDIIHANLALFSTAYSCSQECIVLKYDPNFTETDYEKIAKEYVKSYNYNVPQIKFQLQQLGMVSEEINSKGFDVKSDITLTAIELKTLFINYVLNETIQFNEKQRQKLEQAESLEFAHNYQNAITVYDEILAADKYNLEALEGKIRIYRILEEKNKVNTLYDQIYQRSREKILENYAPFDLPISTYQTKYSEAIEAEIRYWKSEVSLNKLLGAYNEMLSLDRFNEESLLGKAGTLTKLNRLGEAIDAYNYLLKLIPHEQAEKMEEIQKVQMVYHKIH